ncbi:hypothetical protein ACFL6P_06750 [Candidatus Latescibacterota bacterium]
MEWTLYIAAYEALSRLQSLNRFATIVIYSRAPRDIKEKTQLLFGSNCFWVDKGGHDDQKAIESAIQKGLCEFYISVEENGRLSLSQGTGISPFFFRSEKSTEGLLLKPYIRNKITTYQQEIDEFEHIINKTELSEREISQFLNSRPHFPLGKLNRSLRSHLHLLPVENSTFSILPDFILEPINPKDFWKIAELESFYDMTVRVTRDNRVDFSNKIFHVLQQLRLCHDSYDNPVYKERLSEHRIKALKPQYGVVIGRDYGGLPLYEVLATNKSLEHLEIMNYSRLLDRINSGY